MVIEIYVVVLSNRKTTNADILIFAGINSISSATAFTFVLIGKQENNDEKLDKDKFVKVGNPNAG